MYINISELISTPFKTETFNVPVDMEVYELNGEKFPFKDKRELVLTVSNIGNRKVHLEGHWNGSLGIPCGRCLKVVAVPFDIDLDEEIDLSSERQEDDADDSYVERSR